MLSSIRVAQSLTQWAGFDISWPLSTEYSFAETIFHSFFLTFLHHFGAFSDCFS
ncbi:hypothetical protein C4K04_5704 [Pseudomonas chlororaphis]|uniref:Uncharacterized protein n=1 Tax=Pseudomonas chlororaphis TaxID=587753 RepID=A0A3G7TY35_9PSED|nr:hypothetical protein C4K04_5704 [Pseudomonas chlororaphis]